MSILLENVSRYYGSQQALNNVSFQLSDGEVAGFIGPNGAGKSTTMKIISGVLPPSSGTVRVNNIDTRLSPMRIRKTIGYLPENNPLYPDMYIREYLLYVAGIYGIRGRTASQRVEEIIEQTGLTPESRKKIGMLSKGYRQRVGLGQALVHDPDVLILDEPTSGLDPNQIVEIRNLISRVGKEKTVLLSTHIMQEVEAICDRVILIDRGQIKADTSATEIKRSEDGVQTVQLELESTPDPEQWKQLDGIKDVRIIEGNIMLLEAQDHADIRSRIFNHAVKKGLTILSMTLQKRNLEEVFRELTAD